MDDRHLKEYKFEVNNKEFETTESELLGAQIKTIASVPAGYQLFLEVPGEKKEDRLIADGDRVDLSLPGKQKL
ncbi:MAG: multiubiquitin domain-containing protein, partial [Gemmatimonadaceae bacterium]